MRTILIDNEPEIISLLSDMIKAECPQIELVDTAYGVIEGIKSIETHLPDLIFLDVEMNDGTGFDLLTKLNTKGFQVIFVTAHDKYAIKAFRFSALDFLLKPIDITELKEVVEKAFTHINISTSKERLQNLLGHIATNETPRKIALTDIESVHLINVEDIIYCSAEGSYTRFKIMKRKELLVSGHLKEYETLLASTSFYRPHNSFLINMQHVARYDKALGGTVVMTDGSKLPVSVRKKELLLKAMASLS